MPPPTSRGNTTTATACGSQKAILSTMAPAAYVPACAGVSVARASSRSALVKTNIASSACVMCAISLTASRGDGRPERPAAARRRGARRASRPRPRPPRRPSWRSPTGSRPARRRTGRPARPRARRTARPDAGSARAPACRPERRAGEGERQERRPPPAPWGPPRGRGRRRPPAPAASATTVTAVPDSSESRSELVGRASRRRRRRRVRAATVCMPRGTTAPITSRPSRVPSSEKVSGPSSRAPSTESA